MISFRITAKDGAARLGEMQTPHWEVATPAFMAVGTAASVKALGPDDLAAVGVKVILGNTYHLMLRPGVDLIRRQGGLHRFMSWPGPILTDSGGFQVFSLSERRQVSEEGVAFRSHLDGSPWNLTPERSIEIQQGLGADVIMAFDECPPAGASRAYLEESVARTGRWAIRCKAAWRPDGPSALFGIVQGGVDPELRQRSAEEIGALDLPGTALGGYSVGEPKPVMRESVARSVPLLRQDRPRYLMGVGAPDDLLESVLAGVDLFDCVLPTRSGRTGLLFTSQGRLVIRNQSFADDPRPADPACRCYTCRTFSRAYLRHLFQARELLAYRLNSLHNLAYFMDLMEGVRQAIARGGLAAHVVAVRQAWQGEQEREPVAEEGLEVET